jgi:hypothetical protein
MHENPSERHRFPLSTFRNSHENRPGCNYVLGPAVSERRALPLRTRDHEQGIRRFSLGRHSKLTRMGSRRIQLHR